MESKKRKKLVVAGVIKSIERRSLLTANELCGSLVSFNRGNAPFFALKQFT